MSKPLVSYYGGKQRIASWVCESLDKIPHRIYAEPFAGGLAVLYKKRLLARKNKNDYREAINDTNGLLTNLYRIARDRPDGFYDLIQLTPYSKDDYDRALDICKNNDGSDLDRAWAMYVNLNMSFAKNAGTGWGTSKRSQSQAATWDNKRAALSQTLSRLSAVHIDCSDAIAFIDRWDDDGALFYCDPPYINTDCGHYGGYAEADYQALCDKLDSIKGSYVLSNYPCEIAPKSAQRERTKTTTMSAALNKNLAKARTETLWICDRSIHPTAHLQINLFTGKND